MSNYDSDELKLLYRVSTQQYRRRKSVAWLCPSPKCPGAFSRRRTLASAIRRS